MKNAAARHSSIRGRGSYVAVVLALSIAAAAPGAALGQEDERDENRPRGTVPSCPVGNALAAAKQKDEALKTYVAVIKRHPRSKCARDGIAELGKKNKPADSCSVADALKATRQYDSSLTSYVDVLKADPKSPCALSGIEELNARARSCTVGDALLDAQQTETAKSAYSEILKADPESQCAEGGLEKIEEGNTLPERADHVLDEVTGGLLAGLGWTALVLGAAAAIFLGLSSWPWARKKLVKWERIDRLLAPRLRLQDIDDAVDPGIGKGVTALQREYLGRTAVRPAATGGDYPLDRVSGGEGDYRLDRVSGGEELDKVVQGVQAFGGPAKMLGSVVELSRKLLRRARFTASGALQDEGPRGAGLTVLLEGARKPMTTTFWSGAEKDPQDDRKADRYQSLAVPAAAWIHFQVRAALDRDLPTVTSDARSFAFLQGGIESERNGDHETARRFYDAALECDPWNEAAWLNLANIHAREDGRYRLSIRFLEWTAVVIRSKQPAESDQPTGDGQ